MIKKIISSIIISLLFITNVFAADASVSIEIYNNKTATITINGIDNSFKALQLNLTDKNGNTNINFKPNSNFTYNYIAEKKESGQTLISIVIDNNGSLTQNGSLNVGTLTFSSSPNLSSDMSLELVDVDDSSKSTTINVTATITKTEDTSSSDNSFSGNGANVGTSSDEKTDANKNENQQNNTENNNDSTNKIDINSMYPVVRQSNFSDINTHWANQPIKYLADRGIINGMSDSQFAPNNNITRAEFVTLLAKMDNINESEYKSENFTDVASDAWFNPYVDWASKVGITSGVSSTSFAPNANITREQMAVMIERFCEYKGFNLNNNKEEIVFTDSTNISSYAQSSISKVQQAGIINGRPDGTFAPKDNATRAEGAQMIYTMLTIQ